MTPQNFPRKSVGTLFPATKTKPKSPDMTGKIKLQKRFLKEIIDQLSETGRDEAICNIAVWFYPDKRCMSAEVSPIYAPRTQPAENEVTVDQFFAEIQGEQE
jgi:hypothetical protein